MNQALRSRLLEDTAVKALVKTRVDWGVRKQGDPYPAICLTVISDPRPQDYKGFVAKRETRVQIDCYAETRATAAALSEAVIAVITPGGEFFGTKFSRAFIDTVQDRGALSGTVYVHRDKIDALIWHGK